MLNQIESKKLTIRLPQDDLQFSSCQSGFLACFEPELVIHFSNKSSGKPMSTNLLWSKQARSTSLLIK